MAGFDDTLAKLPGITIRDTTHKLVDAARKYLGPKTPVDTYYRRAAIGGGLGLAGGYLSGTDTPEDPSQSKHRALIGGVVGGLSGLGLTHAGHMRRTSAYNRFAKPIAEKVKEQVTPERVDELLAGIKGVREGGGIDLNFLKERLGQVGLAPARAGEFAE